MEYTKKWEFLRIEKKLRLYFLLSCLIVVMTSAFNIYLPILSKDIIQYLNSGYAPDTLLIMAGIYALLWTINQLSLTFREMFMIPVSERLITRLSSVMMKHLHALPYEFHVKAQTGKLINNIKKAQIALPNLLWGIFFFTIPPIIEIVGAVSVLSYNRHFFEGFLLLLTFAVFLIYTTQSAKTSILLHKQSQKYDGDVSAKLGDSLLNFETVKYFGNEELEYENYKTHLEGRELAEISSLISLEKVRIVQFLILGTGFASIILLTVISIINKSMQLGDFVLINSYLIQFFTPLSFLAIIFRNLLRGHSDLMLLLNLLDIHPPFQNHSLETSLAPFQGTIEFKNVSFNYEENKRILKDISFKIEVGKKVGFVGSIGSGKSTLVKLLLRLCNPNEGSILLDGLDLNHIPLKEIKKHIGVMPQVTELFNASIAYNIAYGKPDAAQQEILYVSHNLGIDNFIAKLPNGYQTIVGEKGVSLSGGQRQSIGLARLVLKKPRIIILDEVTSSLDSNAEALILNQLHKLCKDKTTLIIAHKLQHVMDCDKIFVLNDGSIVESGSHEVLMNSKGFYSRLWEEQKKQNPTIKNRKLKGEDDELNNPGTK